MEYEYKDISVNSKIKIICQLYLPSVIEDKIVFYQKPIYVHKKFIEENYNKILNYIKVREEKEFKRYELSYVNGTTG